eukprot:gene660-1328_t
MKMKRNQYSNDAFLINCNANGGTECQVQSFENQYISKHNRTSLTGMLTAALSSQIQKISMILCGNKVVSNSFLDQSINLVIAGTVMVMVETAVFKVHHFPRKPIVEPYGLDFGRKWCGIRRMMLPCVGKFLCKNPAGSRGSRARGQVWDSIAKALISSGHCRFVDQRAVRDRFVKLEKTFKKKMALELRASGIDAERSELDQAMEEIVERSHEAQKGEENVSLLGDFHHQPAQPSLSPFNCGLEVGLTCLLDRDISSEPECRYNRRVAGLRVYILDYNQYG